MKPHSAHRLHVIQAARVCALLIGLPAVLYVLLTLTKA